MCRTSLPSDTKSTSLISCRRISERLDFYFFFPHKFSASQFLTSVPSSVGLFAGCRGRSRYLRVHFKMDWQGQKLAEQLMQILLLVFAVVGFATGYITGSFQMMTLTYAGGVVLTTLVTVPNWPFFNRHPLKWLDPSEAEKHPKPQPQPQQHSTSKKKSSKK
ncbi:hypothetical protein ACFXTH_011767 [Malus domestica]